MLSSSLGKLARWSHPNSKLEAKSHKSNAAYQFRTIEFIFDIQGILLLDMIKIELMF